MRILLLAPNYRRRVNFGHQLFWDEIGRQSDMIQHGAGNPYAGRSSVKQIVKETSKPDVIMFESFKYCSHYTDLAEVDALRVALIGDYFGSNVPLYNAHMDKNKPHVVVLQSRNTLQQYSNYMKAGIVPESKLLLVPHSVCNYHFWNKENDRPTDVLAAWAHGGVYSNRSALLDHLRRMDLNLVEGGWRSSIIFDGYIAALNTSKMMVCANGNYNEVTMKYLESMACGTLFITDRPNDWRWFGFEDGENIVFYTRAEWSNMRSKVEYYLSDNGERKRIAENGMRLVMSRHTNEVRVTDLLRQITSVLEGSNDSTNYSKEDAA